MNGKRSKPNSSGPRWVYLLLLPALLAAALLLAPGLRQRLAGLPEPPDAAEETELPPPRFSPGAALSNADGAAFSPPAAFSALDEGTSAFACGVLPAGDYKGARLVCAGNYLYIIIPNSGETELRCMNVLTGALCGPVTLECQDGAELFCGALDDGTLWLVESGASEGTALSLFNVACEAVLSYRDSASTESIKNVTAAPDGRRIVYEYYDGYLVFDLKRGRISSIGAPAGTPESVSLGRDGMLYGCGGPEGELIAVDPDNGRSEAVEGVTGASLMTEDYAVNTGRGHETVCFYPLEAPEEVTALPGEHLDKRGEGDDWLCAIDGDVLVMLSERGTGRGFDRRVYELSTGGCLQYVDCGGDAEDGVCYALAASRDFGWAAYLSSGGLYVFPIDTRLHYESALEESEFLSRLPDTACGELADEVYRATGVRIYWGDEGCAFGSAGFAAGAADEESSYPTVLTLRNFFMSLPELTVRELLAGVADGLCVYVCNDVRTVPDLGWGMGGFTDLVGGELHIVMDIDDYYWMEGNIAHEFWHAMEYRIRLLEDATGRQYIGGWESVMPADVAALYWDRSPNAIGSDWLGSSAYCADRSGGDEEVWFARSYSRSDPGEDRATVFETMNWLEQAHILREYPHLLEKAGYICSLIRACYPSCAADGTLPWEQNAGDALTSWTFTKNGAERTT